MATETYSRKRAWIRLSAAAGASDQHVFGENSDYGGLAVTVHPGASGTATLAISTRSKADIDAGNADWTDVEFGGQTVLSLAEGSELPCAIQAIRLSAAGAAATANVVGVV